MVIGGPHDEEEHVPPTLIWLCNDSNDSSIWGEQIKLTIVSSGGLPDSKAKSFSSKPEVNSV